MSGLRELQRLFRDALLADAQAPLAAHIRETDLSRRLGIYRNTVFTNLSETLRTLYPVIERLVGADFFDHIAQHYIRRYPSPAGDLNCFGMQLADFLAGFEPASGLAYLPDSARLEWLIHQSHHAAGHPPLDLKRLATVPEAGYEALRFTLHPTARLFACSYPVHRIWQVNQEGYEGDQHVDIDSGGVRLLIERRARHIELQALHEGEWALLHGLAAQQTLATAAESACAVETDFDLAGTLSRLIAQSTLVDFTPT